MLLLKLFLFCMVALGFATSLFLLKAEWDYRKWVRLEKSIDPGWYLGKTNPSVSPDGKLSLHAVPK